MRRDDPIYVRLLQGMGDEALSKTFVSYWTVAQTLATQSRFWLEDAVAEIITAQVRHFGRKSTHVYSYRMLANGDWERQVSVADLGEKHAEHWSDRRPWRPSMKENALREVDLLVGEQERERVQRKKHEAPTRRRRWDAEEGRQASAVDQEQLKRIARAVGGRAIADVAIQCNLLVVEPDPNDSKPHVAAFRFVNPKTISSYAQRKQERVNLLRLYAHLVQEKPFRKYWPKCSGMSRQQPSRARCTMKARWVDLESGGHLPVVGGREEKGLTNPVYEAVVFSQDGRTAALALSLLGTRSGRSWTHDRLRDLIVGR